MKIKHKINTEIIPEDMIRSILNLVEMLVSIGIREKDFKTYEEYIKNLNENPFYSNVVKESLGLHFIKAIGLEKEFGQFLKEITPAMNKTGWFVIEGVNPDISNN